jgi:hypothetical protein
VWLGGGMARREAGLTVTRTPEEDTVNFRTALSSVVMASIVAASVLVPGAAVAHETTPDETPRALAQARAGTARFMQPEAAVAAGYVPTDECVDLPGVGGMGYHYINYGLLFDGTDYAKPEVLIYADQPNGKRKLVALEYIVLDADQDPATIEHHLWAGEHYHGLKGDGVHTPYHYPLHVWIWASNPAGTFEDWNPDVSC